MKSIRIVFVLLVLCALPALADVTAVVNTSVRQDAQLADMVSKVNAKTCAALSLPSTCTDAEAKAKNPKATIYPSANAFFSDVLKDVLQRAAKEYQDGLKKTVGDTLDSMTAAEKNQVCARLNAKDPTIPAAGCWP